MEDTKDHYSKTMRARDQEQFPGAFFVHRKLAVYSACIKEKDLIWGKDGSD